MANKNIKRKEKITQEMELPQNASASTNGKFLLVKGPKGEAKRMLKQRNVSIRLNDNKIVLESSSGKKEDKKMLNSLAAHIKNMINGILQNHVYILKICSGHFPMNVTISGNKLVVKNFLGEKVPRVLELKDGVNVKVEGDLIYVTSASKEIAGQVSADMEQLTRRPGYDSRVFQDGVYLVNRDGKELR